MSPLLELADRVEKLAGPDREVDRMVAVSAYGLVSDESPGYDPKRTFRNAIGRQVLGFNSPLGPRQTEPGDMCAMTGWSAFEVPPFTASLDAARSLVPEGWAYRVDWRPSELDLPRGADPEPAIGMAYQGIGRAYLGKGVTGPIALTAAALRARAAMEPN